MNKDKELGNLSSSSVKNLLKSVSAKRNNSLLGKLRKNLSYNDLLAAWQQHGSPENLAEIIRLLKQLGVSSLELNPVLKKIGVDKKVSDDPKITKLANAIKSQGLTLPIVTFLKNFYSLKEETLLEKIISDKDIKNVFIQLSKPKSIDTSYVKSVTQKLPTLSKKDSVQTLTDLVNYSVDRQNIEGSEELLSAVSAIIHKTDISQYSKNYLNSKLKNKDYIDTEEADILVRDETDEVKPDPTLKYKRDKKDMVVNKIPSESKDYIRHISSKLSDSSGVIPAGVKVKLGDNVYIWKGAQWVNAKTGRILKKEYKSQANTLGLKKASLVTKLPYIKELVNYVADRSKLDYWDSLKDLANTVLKQAALPDSVAKVVSEYIKNGSHYESPRVKNESKIFNAELINESFFAKLVCHSQLGRQKKE